MRTARTGTTSGPVLGAWECGVAAFRGIPYAAPPVEARRFAPPQPPVPWAEARDARAAGPAAPQGPSMLAPVLGTEAIVQREDGCLTVNVFTPGMDGRRPVLLWLHGGAFVTGYAGGPRQSGARLAARGEIVVVTANYRLGPLGYLYLDEPGPDGGGGNAGLLDQSPP